MRSLVIIASIVLASVACMTAQSRWSPPAEARTIAVFTCPGHPQIMATWPARCPYCDTLLRRVLTQAGGAAGAGSGTGRSGQTGTGTAQPGTQQPMPGGGFGQIFPPNQGFGGEESEEPWEGGPEQVYPPNDFGQAYPNQGYDTGSDGFWPPGHPNQRPAPQQYPSPGYGPYPPGQGFPPGQYPPNRSYPQGQYPYPPNDQHGQNEPNSGYGGILDELSRLFGGRRDTQQQPQ